MGIHVHGVFERHPRLEKADYEKAIADLQDGMQQLEPDGRCCLVCHDTGHQAWECDIHNPLVCKKTLWAARDRASQLHELMHAKMGPEDEPDDVHLFLHQLIGIPF